MGDGVPAGLCHRAHVVQLGCGWRGKRTVHFRDVLAARMTPARPGTRAAAVGSGPRTTGRRFEASGHDPQDGDRPEVGRVARVPAPTCNVGDGLS
jgi:hypothetical protein